ncbi:MAG TPA: hypothetical protein VD996_11945 [Chitinophagaceae bacterium]|nr:hypothetical protein [Chitinophagaceae bacterium]
MKKIRGFFIPKKDLDYIFKSPDYANLAGARIYLGLNKGQYCLMMVGVKSDLSNDFPNGIIDEFYPCPTQCPGDDGSLPAAIRQTDLNYNAGIWDQANFGNISPLHIVSFHEIFSLITEGDARKYHLDYLDAPLEIYDAGSSTMNKIRGFFIEKKDLDVIKNNPGYSNLHGARLYMGLLGKQYTLMMVAVKQDNSNDFVNGIIGGFSVSNGRFPGDVSSLSLAVRQSDLNYDAPNGTWKQPK